MVNQVVPSISPYRGCAAKTDVTTYDILWNLPVINYEQLVQNEHIFLYVHQLHHIIKFVIIAQFEHAIYNIVNKMY